MLVNNQNHPDFVTPGFLHVLAGVYCIPPDSNCKHVYSSYYYFLMSSLTGNDRCYVILLLFPNVRIDLEHHNFFIRPAN